MRGSIGDLPVRSEEVILGDGIPLDDSYVREELLLQGEGKVRDDVPSYAESTEIMNE
jgi:hypothetical protein